MTISRKRRKTSRRRQGGSILRLVYYPGYAKSMRSYTVMEPNTPSSGWGAAMKEMENETTDYFRDILANDDERRNTLKKTSTYLINILERPEVADVKEKREKPICLSDAKDNIVQNEVKNEVDVKNVVDVKNEVKHD